MATASNKSSNNNNKSQRFDEKCVLTLTRPSDSLGTEPLGSFVVIEAAVGCATSFVTALIRAFATWVVTVDEWFAANVSIRTPAKGPTGIMSGCASIGFLSLVPPPGETVLLATRWPEDGFGDID